MFRTFLTILAFLGIFSAMMFTSGCGQVKENSNGESDNTATDKQFGQQQMAIANKPEREPDVSGIIKSIVGNEIVVTQVDMDAIREEMASKMASSTGENGNDFQKTNNFSGQGQGQPPAGGQRMGGGPGENSENSEMREQMNELMRQYSLGDVKILIPVGIPMYLRNVEASLTDIIAGGNITIWLDQNISDRKVAEFVNLR